MIVMIVTFMHLDNTATLNLDKVEAMEYIQDLFNVIYSLALVASHREPASSSYLYHIYKRLIMAPAYS